jgi:carboxylesterase
LLKVICESEVEDMTVGCLLIHGFGGDISEIQPLHDYLMDHGITLKCSELKGHTGLRSDLRKVDYQDWIASARRDLESLTESCEAVFIIGFSMGGLIAANLACNNRVAGIATLNSPIYCWNKRLIIRNIIEDLKTNEQGHISHYLKSTVKFPLRALLQFNLLLKRTKVLLKDLKCPLLIAQGLCDDTVSPKSADYILRKAGSVQKTIRYYGNSGHLICHGPDRDILFKDLLEFITDHAGT